MSDSAQSISVKLSAAKQKLREHTRGVDGVMGLGTDGSALRVYVRDQAAVSRIPREVDGILVHIIPSGTIMAQRHAS